MLQKLIIIIIIKIFLITVINIGSPFGLYGIPMQWELLLPHLRKKDTMPISEVS